MNRRELLAGLAGAPALRAAPAKPRNVIFILADDHRYDAMGFMKAQPWLRTPTMDRMAAEGAHFKNAFVTTALCSPSRASILTGVYAHKHRVVDNNTAIPKGTVFFPSHLQKAGYKTSFFGKWHMGGESDDPQPGFDEWVSFRGQGTYLPNKNGLNVNGKHVPQKGYITDELTDYALDWLGRQSKDQPYFMYLSHKAVHAEFEPATRHKDMYKEAKFIYPPTMVATGEMAQHRPKWVQDQRNSWHGVEYPYHSSLDIADYYKRYAETLMGVDDSIGRVLGALDKRGQLDSTLVIYMGDNGFAFGEHGLIDKRTAYEESMRVPMLARCPELFKGGQTVNGVVSGIDIMPTVLAASGVAAPAGLDGMNFLPLPQGQTAGWRKELLYEYYWERNFPQTPTIHALRGDRYKFIRYHGIWDIDELYDLQEDPLESRNLIFSAQYQPVIKEMRERLFKVLEETGGLSMPLWPDRGGQNSLRNPDASKGADFPPELVRRPQRP
ncbi:MAG TPA: sulfatase [Bryobacteraceae bacterium]|nr:sulfatase [Bryobacteraceae bacterium]HPT26894.1 sulfatase [Bryobacteraceae bacterium]